MPTLSPNFKPLPPDWQPPDWIPPPSYIPTCTTDRIKEVASEKIFNPPARVNYWTNIFYERKNDIAQVLGCVGGLASGFLLFLNDRKHYATPDCSAVCIVTAQLVSAIANRIFNSSFFNSYFFGVTANDLDLLIIELDKHPMLTHIDTDLSTKTKYSVEFLPRYIFKPNDQHNFARCNYKTDGIAIHKNEITIRTTDLKIEIINDIPLKTIFSGFVFELVNLYQLQRGTIFTVRAAIKEIDRDEYALLKEYIEFHTCYLADQIMEYGISHLNWSPDLNLWKGYSKKVFDNDYWKSCHYIYDVDGISHADAYRNEWHKISADK